MELTDRKRQILKIVVEEYVAAAEPVGSKAIAQRMPGKISSATIRNELADLTEMGYLEQPHTSAGRVPSAKGYRLYVNELMERRSLSREEEEKLNTSLAEKLAGTDQVMARAGQMVSSFVGYPAYAVADHKTAATVRRFELIPVDQSSFIAVVMLSDSQVKSQLLPLQLPVADGGLPDMSHLLNAHFTGIGAGGHERPADEPVGAGVRPVVPAAEPGGGICRTAIEGSQQPGGLYRRGQGVPAVPGIPGRGQGPRPDDLYGGQ